MLKDAIEQIKDRLQISVIVEQRVKLKRVGNRLSGLCPFHEEKTPSFSVNDKQRFFHCFGCGKHGDVIDFVSETENLSFQEALKKLAALAGVVIEAKEEDKTKELKTFLKEICNWFCANLLLKSNLNAYRYIASRLSNQVISQFKIGYCPGSISGFLSQNPKRYKIAKESGILDQRGRCYFLNRVIFPIENKRGEVIAFGSRATWQNAVPKYINSAENALFKKSEVLYGTSSAINFCKDSLLVVEGYMDVLKLYEHGYKNSVGVLGTSITKNHVEEIFKLSKGPVFCFDGDKAGVNAAKKTIEIIIENFAEKIDKNLKLVFLPQGLDPDELLNNDPEAFRQALAHSKTVSDAILFLCTKGKTFKSPEDFIELESALLTYSNKAESSNIKWHFKSFFKNAIFKLKYKKQNLTKDIDLGLNNFSAPEEEAILLGLAIKFPEILKDPVKEDRFCMLSFKDINLKNLQQLLIEFLNSAEDEVDVANKDFLNKRLLIRQDLQKAALDLVKKTNLSQITNQEQADKLWQKIAKKIELKNLQTEYQKILKSQNLDQKDIKKAEVILSQIKMRS